jgi:hypothetical protein
VTPNLPAAPISLVLRSMNDDWQSLAALAVVALTALAFAVRALRRRGRTGCAGGCGCEKKP